GFIAALPTRHVPRDVLASERGEPHGSRFHPADLEGAAAQADPRQDIVAAASKAPDHRGGLGVVLRLPENLAVDDDGRVSPEHDGLLPYVASGVYVASAFRRTLLLRS